MSSAREYPRAAFGSIRGYLYQSWVGVERWLSLGEGELLVVEGHEDIDRRVMSGDAPDVYEQVKHYDRDVSIFLGVGTTVGTPTGPFPDLGVYVLTGCSP